MKKLAFIAIAVMVSGTALASGNKAPAKGAPAKAPAQPVNSAKACDPACDANQYCLKGQCIDNAVKGNAPAEAQGAHK